MDKVYQIKVTIEDIQPPIWRRLIVPANITFYKLHKIMQAAFGWQDYHLFEFEFPGILVHVPDPEFMYDDVEEKNAKREKINKYFEEYSTFRYIYDMGDYWRHEVVIEKMMKPDADVKYPVCMDGERHRPPEDVGGIGGYEGFLEIIKDPSNPEYNEMLEWAEKDTGGRKFDPEYFYLNEVNRKLAKVK